MSSLLLSLSLLFAPSVVATAPTSPQIDPLIVRSQVHVGNLEVILANLERERTLITITDLNSRERMFSDVIRNHNGYSYSLCLDKLPAGRYVVAVKKGDTVRRQVVLKSATSTMCSAWK